MRLGVVLLSTLGLVLPALVAAQTVHPSTAPKPPSNVIRPAEYGWRNYVTVPDGPCGHPMAVQADCYDSCRPCGPLHPLCFLRRVGRMLDALVPCNQCCRSGHHGGGACGSCCLNPCGSVFDSCCPPSCGTASGCASCSATLPGLSYPFPDDPLPSKPGAQSPAEVRRTLPQKIHTANSPPASPPAIASRPSPYKIVTPANLLPGGVGTRPGTASGTIGQQPGGPSVLRRASGETPVAEPTQLRVDRRQATPINRSHSPSDFGYDELPGNPLRR